MKKIIPTSVWDKVLWSSTGNRETLTGGDGDVGTSEDGVKLGDLLLDLRRFISSLFGLSSQSRISFSEIRGLLLPIIQKKIETI